MQIAAPLPTATAAPPAAPPPGVQIIPQDMACLPGGGRADQVKQVTGIRVFQPQEGFFHDHSVLFTVLVLVVLGILVRFALRRIGRLRDWLRRHELPLIATTVIALLLVVFFAPNLFVTIRSGQVGVIWERFSGGTNLDKEFLEGTHVIAPWNQLYLYKVQAQRVDLDVTVLTIDGLSVHVDMTVHSMPVRGCVGELQKYVGLDYLRVALIPEIEAAVRAVVSTRTAEQVYRLTAAEIFQAVQQQPQFVLQQGLFHIIDILITNVRLPAEVQRSIQQKLQEEQRIGQMYYRLDVERLEAQRKTIEAQGIQNFQAIVSEGISPQFLQWKGIDATLELARSNNAKVVVIGAGSDGLPIILGGLDGTTAATGAGGTGGTAGAAAGAGADRPAPLQLPRLPPTLVQEADSGLAPPAGATGTTAPGTQTLRQTLERLLTPTPAPPSPTATPAPAATPPSPAR